MRRQRVLRRSSASSLCIFCACRLGAIEASSTSIFSSPSRRFQSTTTSPASENGSVPPWYDPTSSLSMSEQREKANRMSMRQQHETEQNTARQERLWKEEEERNRARQESEAKRKAESAARSEEGQRLAQERRAASQAKKEGTAFRRVDSSETKSVHEAVDGSTLRQAMFATKKREERNNGQRSTFRIRNDSQRANNRDDRSINLNRVRTVRVAGQDQETARSKVSANANESVARRTGERQRGGRGNDKPASRFLKKTEEKRSNPFGGTAATGGSAAATSTISGWGAGSTETAPLQYGELAEATVARSVLRPGEEDEDAVPNTNIHDKDAIRVTRAGTHKVFKPQYDPTDEEPEIEYSRNDVEESEPQDLQAQQSIYDQAAKAFAELSPKKAGSTDSQGLKYSSGQGSWGARNASIQVEDVKEGENQPAEQLQPASTETGAPEAFDHGDFLDRAGYTDSYATEPVPESAVAQDQTPSSSEAGAPEAYDHSPGETSNLGEAPAISYSSAPTDSSAAIESFGRYEDEAEPALKPQRQEPPQTEERLQELDQPESRAVEQELSASSFGSFESDAEVIPETRHDDPPSQTQTLHVKPASSSPLAQIAQQTQPSLEKTADPRKTASSPPPPPSVPPPPPSAIPAGGQLAWQPIEGHAQGGQWVWQSTPAVTPPQQPASAAQVPQRSVKADSRSSTLTSQRSSYVPPVRTPSAPSVSLGDSGYRATPFKADEYQSQSSFDEEKAANWQHLRKRSTGSAQSQAASQPTPAPVQQQQQPKPQVDYDDEFWVDRTFNNHVREREEKLKVQKEREQQRQAQQEEREKRDQAQTRGYQPPASNHPDGPRRLYDRPAQAYKDRACARCGEKGHIARFCPKSDVSPFDRPNTGMRSSNDGRSFQGDRNERRPDTRTRQPFETRQSGNPFESREQGTERVRNPFESRELGQNQRPRTAWGADQVFSAEAENVPNRVPRFDTVKRFVPGRGFEDTDAPQKFEPVGGRRSERDQDATTTSTGRDAGRRSERLDAEQEVDEHAPAPETRQSREKAARKSRWAEAEDEGVEEKPRGAGRKAQRAGRREYDEDEDDEAEARDNFRARKAARQAEKEAKEEKRRKTARREREVKKSEDATPISIPEFVSVQQLSQLLGVRYEQFIDRLEDLGYDDVFPGMTLNSETSGMIAMEYNFDPTIDTGVREEEERDLKPRPELEDQQFLPTRPPVVTIMGHVDHGKTTILDYLRKSSVAAGEAGGITQHIGAFSVPMASSGKTITFLDTPGHAAFLAMRQRGANVTDIVILVVAADDSVKPQTLEAIKHAKAAGVPMIVAINKVDKEEADIERVKQDLARHGVEIEDFGGETQIVPVSGKTGKGMDELEETVVALSEILDHRAETDGAVEGWILEATTKERGRVATVLVRRGTLKPGAVIVAGKTWARVRSLRNEAGRTLNEVGPGMPIEVDGWRDQPMAGDEVIQAPTEQKATSVVEFREEREEREKAAADMEAINEARRTASERQAKEREAAQALKQAQRTANAEGGTADVAKPDDLDAPEAEQTGQIDVPFIIKADVSGSAEAVSAYIMSVSNPLITPSILQSSVGPVHESDVELANAAGGHIIAFNLPPDPQMQGQAEAQGVKILENNIIYRVLDDVKAVLEEKLPPIVSQRVLGEAEVGAAFEISIGGRKKLKIAGCKVRNGAIGRGSRVRIMRGAEKVYDGTITSLKNVKKDVDTMRKGSECGMGFEGWEGFEVGDQVQTYEEISEKRKL